jgi:hypothetical protein
MEKDLGKLQFTTPSSHHHYEVDWYEFGYVIHDDDLPGEVELRVYLYNKDSSYKSLDSAIKNLLNNKDRKKYAEQYLSSLLEGSFLDE